jgi:hypothetical protein
MAEETSRMKIPYPSQGQANYYEVFKSGMDAIDADVFALWSKINAIFHGGGAITWSLNGSDYEFTYGDAIVCQIPSSGTAQSIAPATIVIPPSHFGILDAAFGATSAGSLFGSVATQVSVDPSSSAFCWHNPTTHELVFSTGLVLALGDTATGIQPQGGGGGSISVTDGTTTVTPATTLTFTDGAAVVTDAGGGDAEVQIQLTTNFVVSADGSTFYSDIQSAIDDAYSEYGTSGKDQVVFVRSGTYTETLTFKNGVALVAEASPQTMDAKEDEPYSQNRTSPTAVIVEGQVHTFEPVGGRIRCTIRGIVFSSAVGSSDAMFDLADTSAAIGNKVSFVDCFFFSDSSGAIWEQNAQGTDSVEVSFYGCKFAWHGGTGNYEPMFYFGSDGTAQLYLFTDCEFFARHSGKMIFRSDGGAGAGEVKITRCKFDKVDLDDGGLEPSINADLSLTDVVMQQPDRRCVTWGGSGTVYTYGCCTLEVANSYPAIEAQGPIICSSIFTVPWVFTGETKQVASSYPSVSNYVMSYRAVEGTTYQASGVGVVDLQAYFEQGGTITNVSWDTVGSAGTRRVELHDAAYTQGMYFTVWDNNNNANNRNITVTSPATAGGVTGPHTVVANANGSLTFVASLNQLGQACWRSISYFH